MVSGTVRSTPPAPHAEGQIDMRYIEPADRARTLAAIRKSSKHRRWRARCEACSHGEFSRGAERIVTIRFDAYAWRPGCRPANVRGRVRGGVPSRSPRSVGTPTICGSARSAGQQPTPSRNISSSTSIVPARTEDGVGDILRKGVE